MNIFERRLYLINNYQIQKNEVERIKQCYPVGTRIELINMSDLYSPVESVGDCKALRTSSLIRQKRLDFLTADFIKWLEMLLQ